MKDEVLYLEADEEITAAIDKMVKMASTDVKIVVPKRSTLLQSLVNLKLLKRAADEAGKNLVLVTGDRTSTHLAGRLGLAVASTLTSQPVTPQTKQPEPEASDEIEAQDDDSEEAVEGVAAATAAVPPASAAQAAKKPSFAKPMMVRKSVAVTPEEAEAAASVAADPPITKGEKKPRVPDFNAMQKRLLWGVGIVGALILIYILNYFLASASVTLYAKGSKIDTNFAVTIDPTAKTNPAKAILAATSLQSSHDLTATATATGKKDVGAKASGQVTVTNYCYNPGTLPAGTIFTAQGGLKFTSTQDVAVPTAVPFLGNCGSTSVAVPVAATQNGDGYNLASGTLYTVGSAPSDKLKGTGNQMQGGTSKTVDVVTQDDIDKIKADLLAKDKDSAQKDLENKVASGSRAIAESFIQTAGAVTANPAAGSEGSQSVVVVKVSYSELAVASSDIDTVLNTQELLQIGNQNQIYDDGLSGLKITATKNVADAASQFNFATEAYGGAKLDPAAIATQLAGKKYGDAADQAAKLPGVDKADISLSPFWSSSLPHISSHIKITIKVAGKG